MLGTLLNRDRISVTVTSSGHSTTKYDHIVTVNNKIVVLIHRMQYDVRPMSHECQTNGRSADVHNDGHSALLRYVSTSRTKLRRVAPHESKQRKTEQNGAKLCLLAIKKLMFVDAQASSTFCVRTFEGNPKVLRQRRHWVTPLFKSRFLENVVTG